MQRVAIIGQAGAGKSTLSQRLGARLALPVVELDALFWEPGWQQAAPERFRARVAAAVAGPRWISDGNYSRVHDLTLGRADTILWLDYPLPLLLWRLLRRTSRRVVLRETLWSGNRERLRDQFRPEHSLVWYVIRQYRPKRERYATMMRDGWPAGAAWQRHRTPRETARWLAHLEPCREVTP